MANYPRNKLTIKALAEEDRPREKLLNKGKHSLTNAELLALLIGSGSSAESAVQLCQRITSSCDHNLNKLGSLSVKDLCQFKGIGEAKAITIIAALELGKRRQLSDIPKNVKITASKNVYQIMAPVIGDLAHEEFWTIYLNRANKVIFKEKSSQGGLTGTVVDQKLIFHKALQLLATGIILCHNHPSGNLKPSQADKQITRKIGSSAQLLEINLLDHLIISQEGFFSFADEGLL